MEGVGGGGGVEEAGEHQGDTAIRCSGEWRRRKRGEGGRRLERRRRKAKKEEETIEEVDTK